MSLLVLCQSCQLEISFFSCSVIKDSKSIHIQMETRISMTVMLISNSALS